MIKTLFLMFSFHIFAAHLTNPLKNARFYEKTLVSTKKS